MNIETIRENCVRLLGSGDIGRTAARLIEAAYKAGKQDKAREIALTVTPPSDPY